MRNRLTGRQGAGWNRLANPCLLPCWDDAHQRHSVVKKKQHTQQAHLSMIHSMVTQWKQSQPRVALMAANGEDSSSPDSAAAAPPAACSPSPAACCRILC